VVRRNDIHQAVKVLHIGHVPLPVDHPLGNRVSKYAYYPGRWVLNLAKAQADYTSDQVEIIIKVPGGNRHWTTNIEGISCHFISVPNILRGKTGFFIDQRILASQALMKQPDIVHAHGTEEANALAALRTGLPRVLTLQGCFFIINRKFPARFFSRQWIVERLEHRSIPRFEHVITKSSYIDLETRRSFPKIKTHFIPNTYDSFLENIDAHQDRENAVAYVGTIDPRKGFDLVVEAFSKLSSSNRPLPILRVFGNQPKPSKWEATHLARAKKILGKKLVLHGQIHQRSLVELIAKCRCLVAPSREEMFGNQIIEALLVGTSVIVTENTAMAENVERYGNGTIVPQNNSSRVAQSIEFLISNALNTTTSTSARNSIIQAMGPRQISEEHERLYREVFDQN
jgi:glycosyltransferase involved in cell wall biosynthesis